MLLVIRKSLILLIIRTIMIEMLILIDKVISF